MHVCYVLGIIILQLDRFLFEVLDNAQATKERIPYKFAAEPTLPAMVVFNVDELIWPFKVDEVMTPPLKKTRTKYQIKDRVGKLFDLFPEAGPILEELFNHWYKVGGLLQTTDPEKIEEIMNLYDIDKYFKILEVFPRATGSKTKHLKRISEHSDVPLEDILYFDTNEEDLEEIRKLNVIGVHVTGSAGLTYEHIEKGFRLYLEVKNHTESYHYAHHTNVITAIPDPE